MTPSSPATSPPKRSIEVGDFLRRVPKTVALLDAAVATLSATLLPRRLIPANLDALGPVVSLLVLLCFIITIRYREALRRRVAMLAIVSGAALLGLLAMQILLVCTVPGYGSEEGTAQFLVGFRHTAEGQANAAALGAKTCTDLIRGAGASRIPAIWGGSYAAAALFYVMTYVGFIVGAVLALGGTGLARPEKSRADQG